jgi:hypothetical protein
MRLLMYVMIFLWVLPSRHAIGGFVRATDVLPNWCFKSDPLPDTSSDRPQEARKKENPTDRQTALADGPDKKAGMEPPEFIKFR